MTAFAHRPQTARLLPRKLPRGTILNRRGEPVVALTDRAFFSAKVDDIRTVASLQAKVQEALDLSSRDAGRAFMDKSNFIAQMRNELGALPGDSGDLQDITSAKRLGLIYDFQVEDAMEFGRHQIGQDPDLLDAFPAQELVRIEARLEEREWDKIWQDAGGTLFDGRMIARKDSPVWLKISDFGRPWPPFKFGSGMGVDDVARDEAEELGVLGPDDTVAPTLADFNQGLQANLPASSPGVLEGFKSIFGDQVDVITQGPQAGKVTWQGDRIGKLYADALAGTSSKWSLDLGEATADTVAQGKTAGVDLTGARLHLTADDIRHANKGHGEGETQGDQRPITARDFKLVPHVWRAPDSITPGAQPGTLVLKKAVAGQQVVVAYNRLAKTPKWGLRTLYIKTEVPPGATMSSRTPLA